MRTTEEKLHKKAVLERIKAMPDRFTVDELFADVTRTFEG